MAYFNRNTGRAVIPTQGVNPQKNTYGQTGSTGYFSSQGATGPKVGGGGFTIGGSTPAPPPAYPAPKPPASYPNYQAPQSTQSQQQPRSGVLSTPGTYEQWYEQNRGELNAPTQGEGVLGEAAGYFRQPNRTAGYADQALAPGGYFSQPGSREGYSSRQLPGLESTKGAQESLYESGNQGLNTFYDRERDKRQKRLEDTMAGMGVFGSGATARGMYELEAELGAQQARDMADLAAGADSARMARLGEARATAGAGDEGAIERYSTGAEMGYLADASVDRQGRGLGDVGESLDMATGRRQERAGGAATKAQSFFEDRETGGLRYLSDLAKDKAGLIERFSTASNAEQAAIKEEIIQSVIAEAGVDRAAAEQIAEEILTSGANYVRTQK